MGRQQHVTKPSRLPQKMFSSRSPEAIQRFALENRHTLKDTDAVIDEWSK
jgi:hypothetical protein